MTDRILEPFQEACGAGGPLQLDVALDPGPSEPHAFSQPFLVLGRGQNADLRLNRPLISRRHAYLQVIDGRVLCVDLGSRTGTHRGDASGFAGWLDGDQVLQIGPALIRPGGGTWGWDRVATDRGTAEPSPLDPRGPEHDPLPAVTLEFPSRSRDALVYPFDGVLMLAGRAPECRLRLSDPSVSKFHCGLLRTPTGVWVVDLFGRGGISVNDARVRYARLDDGDRLQVGRHVIRLRYGEHQGTRRALPKPRSTPAAIARVRPENLELGRSPSGPTPEQVEFVGALLGPLLREFGAMQRQMAEMQQRRDDELQLALISMFQMFSSMHRDQMALLREEMDQINRLALEQRALESELAAQRSIRPDGPKAATSGGVRREPDPSPQDRGQAIRRPTVARPVEEKPNDPPGTAKPRAPGQRPSPEPVEPDMHAWLNQRIASIREERQGRWQKVLSAVTGQKLEAP